MEKIRVGTVGLGPRGRALLRLAAKFDCTEIAAACDIRPRNWFEPQWRASVSMAEQFPGAVFFDNYDEMLEKGGLDLVLVETGADIHAEFCAKALEREINVLSDIPVVASLREADRLWKAAQRSKALFSTGANPNEQRFAVLLKEFAEKGLLGKPYCMEAEYIHWFAPGGEEEIHFNENGDWRKLLAPIRYCTHSLGPLLSILDEDLREVSCFGTGQQADPAEYAGSTKEDMMCAQFRTDSGVVVRLMRNGRCRAQIGHHNYRVFGTEGYMERIDRFGKPVIRYNSTRAEDPSLQEVDGRFMPPAYENNADATGHGGMDYAMLDHVFTALKAGGPAPIPLRAGLAMTLPGIYAEESARRGGEVLRMLYPWYPDWKTEI